MATNFDLLSIVIRDGCVAYRHLYVGQVCGVMTLSMAVAEKRVILVVVSIDQSSPNVVSRRVRRFANRGESWTRGFPPCVGVTTLLNMAFLA